MKGFANFWVLVLIIAITWSKTLKHCMEFKIKITTTVFSVRGERYISIHFTRRPHEQLVIRWYPKIDIHCSLLSVHSSLFLFPVNCSMLTVHRLLFTVHCSRFTVNCSLFTVHCSLFTVHGSLLTVHCCTVHCSTVVLSTVLLFYWMSVLTRS